VFPEADQVCPCFESNKVYPEMLLPSEPDRPHAPSSEQCLEKLAINNTEIKFNYTRRRWLAQALGILGGFNFVDPRQNIWSGAMRRG
jgi:hypothetical protein